MPENSNTSLLTLEENELVFDLLGPRCRTLSTTIVQLFTTRGKRSEWHNEGMGVLCLVKDDFKRSYYFRILRLADERMIWEQELYSNMDYLAPKPFFHTFEAEDCIAAFNFADENEAAIMRRTVLERLEMVKRRTNNIRKPESQVVMRNDVHGSDIKSNPRTAENKSKNKKRGRKGKKPQLTTLDIGLPTGFQHIGHVGWATTGTGPSMGLQLQKFLQKAGVSDSHLKDKDTWNFILDFITENGGMEAVAGSADEVTPTFSPGSASAARGPPVYPKPHTNMSTRPLPAIPERQSRVLTRPSIPPRCGSLVSPSSGVPNPPPPPPLLPPADISSPPFSKRLEEQDEPLPNNPRALLLDAIHNRPKLKKTENNAEREPKEPVNSRDNLLSQIRGGVILKRVSQEEHSAKPRPPPNSTGCLASALKEALLQRFADMNPDLDEFEENDDPEDGWGSDDTN